MAAERLAASIVVEQRRQRTSRRVVAARSWITACGITLIVCGASIMGWVYLGEDGCRVW